MSQADQSSLLFLAIAIVACAPGLPPDGSGEGGGASSTITSIDGSSGTAVQVDSSDGFSTGVDFACPEAVWHEGNLVIDDTTDLDAIRSIGGVTGSLRLADTNSIADLEFLSCLEVVDGTVTVRDNNALVDLHGLERLRAVNGNTGDLGTKLWDLGFVGNPMLPRIGSLDALEELGILVVESNESLTEIEMTALRQVQTILLGGWCQAGGPTPGQPLSTVGTYPALEHVGVFVVYGQYELASLGSMIELADRGVTFGEVVFEYNYSLPQSEIDAFAMAASTMPEACSNKDDMEECPRCPAGE